jgi:hypothetical protein
MWLLLFLFATAAQAADFDLSLAYGQSRDFWRTVHEVQDRTGNLSDIQSVVKDRYGRPDILYSHLDAAYSYRNGLTPFFGQNVIGTRAEALAGGEVSNPISPEIRAYANSVGIFSAGLRSIPDPIRSSFLDFRLLAGLGPEKRLYAQGAEFIDAIPVRSGTLLLGGAELLFLSRSAVGDDFWITTDLLLRGTYFHSSTPPPKSRPEEVSSFSTWRWKLQNEWLKETETFLSSRTRFGIISVLGQTPLPFLNLPLTWDYQQQLEFYPGLASVSGIGGILRILSRRALPNLALFGGYFGGAPGAGLDLQLGSVLLTASTFGVENRLSPAREHTRIWNASLGVAL